jgi:hypothetical protein
MSPLTVLPSSGAGLARLAEFDTSSASGQGEQPLPFETVNVALITSVPPAFLSIAAVIVCWPSASSVES